MKYSELKKQNAELQAAIAREKAFRVEVLSALPKGKVAALRLRETVHVNEILLHPFDARAGVLRRRVNRVLSTIVDELARAGVLAHKESDGGTKENPEVFYDFELCVVRPEQPFYVIRGGQ